MLGICQLIGVTYSSIENRTIARRVSPTDTLLCLISSYYTIIDKVSLQHLLCVMHGSSSVTTVHPLNLRIPTYNTGTAHVGFSPTT